MRNESSYHLSKDNHQRSVNDMDLNYQNSQGDALS
jgi:hypothetical protein